MTDITADEIITKCDAIASSELNQHGQLSKIRVELDKTRTMVNELTNVIHSSRDIDLIAAYSVHRPHTDKWFREDGTLKTNKFSRASIPIRAYRARIPLIWANTPTREVHIKITDPTYRHLNLPVDKVINEVVGPESAECDYLDDYTELVYWYFQAPDSECDRLAVEIVNRLLDIVYHSAE